MSDTASQSIISPAMQAILDGMTPLVRRNRIELIQKVADGTAAQWMINLLQSDGLMDAAPNEKSAAESGDQTCDTQEALAVRLMKHYQNPDGTSQLAIEIDKKVISDWCKLKRLDAGQHEPPGTIDGKKRGKYSLKAWVDWFDKWMLPEKKAGGVRGAAVVVKKDSRQRREDAAARIAEAEADRIEKENNGLYTLTMTAARSGAGLGIIARNATRDLLEKQLLVKFGAGLEAVLPDEATRAAVLDKLRRDGIELLTDWQNNYKSRATEIIKLGAIKTEADK